MKKSHHFLELFALTLIYSLIPFSLFAYSYERTLHDERDNSSKYLSKVWSTLTSNSNQNKQILIHILMKSKVGENLIRDANKKVSYLGLSDGLITLIQSGEASYTDTILQRKLSLSSDNGSAILKTRHQIFINKNLTVQEAVIDLAHELTHFIFKSSPNPYQERSTLKNFITSTIDGRGGEVDAYIMECFVWRELFSKSENGRKVKCNTFLDEEQKSFDRVKIVQEFYKLGQYSDLFEKLIERHLEKIEDYKWISKEETQFISGVYDLPYPLAAIKEYEQLQSKICKNDRKFIQRILERKAYQPTKSIFLLIQNYNLHCKGNDFGL